MHQERSINLAVAQMGPVNLADEKDTVVSRLIEMMDEAKGRSCDFVLYPELALTTFFPRYWVPEITEMDRYFETEMPNKRVAPLFEAARKHGIGFYLGYAELTPEGRRFNTSIIVNKTGSIIAKYRKIHLPGHSEYRQDREFQHLEKRYFQVGDLGFGVSELLGAKVGMGLCNDRRWAETYRVMALQGADLILFGYNTPAMNQNAVEEPHLKMFHNLLSIQAGAYQNSVWVAAAAKSGSEDGHRLIGGSAIIAPTGEVVAKAHTQEDEVITSVIDLSLGDYLKEHIFNFDEHRRPEHYQLIVDRTGRGSPESPPAEFVGAREQIGQVAELAAKDVTK